MEKGIAKGWWNETKEIGFRMGFFVMYSLDSSEDFL